MTMREYRGITKQYIVAFEARYKVTTKDMWTCMLKVSTRGIWVKIQYKVGMQEGNVRTGKYEDHERKCMTKDTKWKSIMYGRKPNKQGVTKKPITG